MFRIVNRVSPIILISEKKRFLLTRGLCVSISSITSQHRELLLHKTTRLVFGELPHPLPVA